LDIKFTVGRTGQVVPNAILEPVVVMGSTISKTTLHNEDFVNDLELKIGDVVVSTDAVEHDFDTTALGDPPGYISRMDTSVFKADEGILKIFENFKDDNAFEYNVYLGRIGSGDRFISSKEEKDRIWNTFGAYAADMEGAAIAHTCYLNKIPFVVIRSISDNADGEAEISYNEFKDIAANNSGKILEYMIEKI
jgi:adenosylhomocysteine nucleosidase